MYKDHSDSHPYLQYEKQNTKFLHADFVGFPTLGNLFRALDQQSDLSMKKKECLFQDYLESHVNKCICSLITVRVRPMSSFKMRVSKLQDVDFGSCGFGENSEVFNGIHLCGRSI